jgi:serine/threonine protein kinase
LPPTLSRHASAALRAQFGFAVFCVEAGEQRKLRVRCGTPVYTAPELLVAGKEYYGPPVDMWAWAAMVYEMLHGRVAFHGQTLPQVEQRIRAGGGKLSYSCSADARDLVQAGLRDRAASRLDAPSALRSRWFGGPAPSGADAQPQRLDAQKSTPGTTVV